MRRFCRWITGIAAQVCAPPSTECARWDTVAETICDATQTLTETICDATQTVTRTFCDATTTVTQTVCDATQTVTNTICDSWGQIPIIGGLICLISRTVSTVVCVASHVVSTVVCTASRVVSEVVCTASRVVSTVVCIASHIVSTALCVAWTIAKAAACVFVGGAASASCAVANFRLGPGPILRSTTRDVPSVPRPAAFARSFALGTDLSTVDLRSPYDEEGVHIEYRLVNGTVHWAVGPGAAFNPLEPLVADLPSFAVPRPSGMLAVSYDDRRLGAWVEPPRFDMIAAGGDRAIVKKEGTDEIFILVTANPYVHRIGERRILLPQSYFKLDPELGMDDARIVDLVTHVVIAGDDERHPATERFPAFRKLFQLGEARVVMPPLVRRLFQIEQIDLGVRLFKGAGDLGLMQEMDVRFVPRVWHEVDLRPLRDSKAPPTRWRSYEHVVYQTGNPFDSGARRSVSYERVLDLSVGLSHLHEQHDQRFGGEIDNLSDEAWKLLGLIPLPGSDEAAYRLANGPIRDYGGWIDGTCIYYLLVQLKRDDEISANDPASLRDAFAILWADEQMAFTERWRVLHPDDKEFKSPFKPIVALVSSESARFYPDAPYDMRRYWCPFTEGHVTPSSRMAVTRQIVAVTGRNPSSGEPELYSIHFSWPTMDRTWRWRRLPDVAVRLTGDRDAEALESVAFADTLQIRDDTTILLRGRKTAGGRSVAGRWFQRYLPADGQEIPSVTDLLSQPERTKPSTGYSHPWDFVSEEVFGAAHQSFSHFGIYEPVRSRVQFYRITLTDSGGLSDAAIERAVWEDTRHALRHVHVRLDWAAAANVFGGGGTIEQALPRRTHPSMYNDPMTFKLARRVGLNPDGRDWILMHFDKRDDKLLPFDGIGTEAAANVALTNRDEPQREITVSVDAHFRTNVRDLHGLTVTAEVDAVSPPQVRRASVTATRSRGVVTSVAVFFELARNPDAAHTYGDNGFEVWVAMNVWRVKLGALVPTRERNTSAVAPEPLVLFDVVRADVFTAAEDRVSFSGMWMPQPDDQRQGLLSELLTPEGRIYYGTSLWFVGATGLASCADETQFATIDA